MPPPEDVLWSSDAPLARRARVGPLAKWLIGIGIALVAVLVAAMAIHVPYYTISPGSSLDVNDRVTIDGASTYPADGELLLLFVRQSANVSLLKYLQAKLDPDIDEFPSEEFTGGQSPEEVNVQSDADMALAQIAAKKVALEQVGYDVPLAGSGVVVLAVLPSRPAHGVVEAGDVILTVDGVEIHEADDLGEEVRRRSAGDELTLTIEREGKPETKTVGVELADDGTPVIGVYVSPRYDFPIDVDIDTRSIGGPSAGLAMTLSIIDTLTPGELTGGLTVAITGTIAPDGSVGEIGGLSQKTVAARSADADLFIVPKCTAEATRTSCEADLEHARDRADGLRIVPVANVDEALRALAEAGGDPVQNAAASLR